MTEIPAMQVLVRFGKDIPYDARNAALLESRGDDSRLRAAMTPEQRAKL